MRQPTVLIIVALAALAPAARGRDLAAEVAGGGLAGIEVLVKQRESLRDVRLDEAEGLALADAIMTGFPWREEYVDRRHQQDLFKVKDRVIDNDLTLLSWLFVRWVEHPHPYVRLHGTHRLADLKATRHTDVVLECLADPDARVRMGAASALLAFRATAEAERVAGLLTDPNEHVRKHAVTVLAELGGRAMVREIAGRLADPKPAVRSRAAYTLEQLEAREALPQLRTAAAEEQVGSVRAVLLATIRTLASQRGTRREVKIVKSMSGHDSGVVKRAYHLVTDDEAWADLWKRHRGGPAPEVDFTKTMAVAIFQGRGVNSNGVSAAVTEDDETIRVRFDDQSYQSMGGGNQVTAYGIFLIPASTKPVVLEEDVQGLIGGEPTWRERARLKK
jgi:HEAT repeat protein